MNLGLVKTGEGDSILTMTDVTIPTVLLAESMPCCLTETKQPTGCSGLS